MAKTSSRSGYGKRAMHVLGLFSMLISMHRIDAKEYKVGGSKGWTVPDPNGESFNQWAERNRFQIGDSLLFVYKPEKDSVLRVDKESYDNCNISSYITPFDDGHTTFTFDTSGPFYFISGKRDNCLKNEKIVVVAMVDRSKKATSNGVYSMQAKYITSLGALLCSSLLFIT